MEPTAPEAGDLTYLGDWQVISKLGDGGMGSVYLGSNANGLVALKTLHPGMARTASGSERFRREYAAARAIDSPFVSPVVGEGLNDPVPFLAFQYIEGPTLDEFVRLNGVLRGQALAEFGRDLATGISAIHGAGVVHRDVKPSNVVLTDHGPVIIDFGIALMGDLEQLTATNQIVGSPGWIAPEQIEGDVVGPATDVFGWGAVMHFAANGENPYGSGNSQALLYRIVHGTPHPHGIDGTVGESVAAAMSRSPGQRPAIDEVAAAMRHALVAPASEHKSPGWFMGSAVGATLISILTIAAVVFVGFALLMRLIGDSNPETTVQANAIEPTAVVEDDPSATTGATADEADQLSQPRPSRDQEPVFDALVTTTSNDRDNTVLTVSCESGQLTSLTSVGASSLGPGDAVQLERGCRFVGPLRVAASGSEAEPLTVGAWGDTDLPMPIVENDGQAMSSALIRLLGNYIHLSDIDFQMYAPDVHPTCDDSPNGWIVGVAVTSESHHNRIDSIRASGGYAGVFIDKGSHHNVVTSSTFDKNTMMNDVSGANGVLIFGADNNVISNNRFSGHIACHPEFSSPSGSGIAIFGGFDNEVSSNVSTGDNALVSVDGDISGQVGGYGGTLIERNVVTGANSMVVIRPEHLAGEPTIISNNSSYADHDESIGVFCNDCTSSDVAIQNNIVWAGRLVAPTDVLPLTPGFDDSNVFWRGSLAAEGDIDAQAYGVGGAQIADPLYVDAASGDLRITACSPAIEQEAPDRGAYEYEGPTC